MEKPQTICVQVLLAQEPGVFEHVDIDEFLYVTYHGNVRHLFSIYQLNTVPVGITDANISIYFRIYILLSLVLILGGGGSHITSLKLTYAQEPGIFEHIAILKGYCMYNVAQKDIC